MKNSNQPFIRTMSYNLFILGFIFLFSACNSSSEADKNSGFNNIIWNVKAIHPDGKTLDIKAFDKDGNSYDIKAIQNSDQHSFLDVKALGDGIELSVKMLVSNDRFIPIKAIDRVGTVYDIKAVTSEGEKLDVKGVARSGSVVVMKAISKDGDFYGVKAISPTGELNDIRGIKINVQKTEMVLNGIRVLAHVKAMHPADNDSDFEVFPEITEKGKDEIEFDRIVWNIKAVTTDGRNLDVKAFDDKGDRFDVKAIQDTKQHSFMNIRAFVNLKELPVKIIYNEEGYSSLGAIGSKGNLYEIKAIDEGDVKLDVKGISRSGNIVNVKAVKENGEFYGVKAFSPDGELNDVKGIKIFDRKVELKIKGNPVYAHLKAISQ